MLEHAIVYLGWFALAQLAYAAAIPLFRFTLFYVPRSSSSQWMRREAWGLASWWPVTVPLFFAALVAQRVHRRRELRRKWDAALSGEFPPPIPECAYCAGALASWEHWCKTKDGRSVHPECRDALLSVEAERSAEA